MLPLYCFLLGFCIWQSFSASSVAGCTTKEQLFRDLTKDYEPAVDPGKTTLEITLNVVCVNTDQLTGLLVANVWEYLSWKDSRLRWIPSEYDGIDTLRVPSRFVWIPDVKLYNSAQPFAEREMDTNTVVSSDGTVLWVPRATYRVLCTDLANCRWRVASWTHDGNNVELKAHGGPEGGIDLSTYDETCPLVVASHTAQVVSHIYPCCKEPYPSLDVTLSLQPRTA